MPTIQIQREVRAEPVFVFLSQLLQTDSVNLQFRKTLGEFEKEPLPLLVLVCILDLDDHREPTPEIVTFLTPSALPPRKKSIFLVTSQDGSARGELDILLRRSLGRSSKDRHDRCHGRLKGVRSAGNINGSRGRDTGVSTVQISDQSEGLDG